MGEVAREAGGALRVRLPDVASSVLHVLLRFLYLDSFEAHLLTATKLAITAAVVDALPPAGGAAEQPRRLNEDEMYTLRTIDGAYPPPRPLPM